MAWVYGLNSDRGFHERGENLHSSSCCELAGQPKYVTSCCRESKVSQLTSRVTCRVDLSSCCVPTVTKWQLLASRKRLVRAPVAAACKTVIQLNSVIFYSISEVYHHGLFSTFCCNVSFIFRAEGKSGLACSSRRTFSLRRTVNAKNLPKK